MDNSAKVELESIKTELRSIIQDLEDISKSVRGEFVGIGSDKCANCIDNVVGKYRKALKKLNNIKTD